LEGLAVCFTLPDLNGLGRWFQINYFIDNYDSTPHELTVYSQNAWIYKVAAWNRACYTNAVEKELKAYWSSGDENI
jgi:hypothetical protein